MLLSKELFSLLKQNYVYESFFTHVSLIQPKGKYSLSRTTLSKFLDLYCKIIIDNDIPLGIAESPQSHNAVIVDVDLKFKSCDEEKDTRLYTLSFVEKLIQIYQQILKTIVEDITEKELLCVLLEKPIYTTYDSQNNEIYKNGFHLHFPHLFLDKVSIEIILIPQVRQQMSQNTLNIRDEFEKFSHNLINNEDTENFLNIIDSGALKNSWLLYGSRKSEIQNPYKISNIYNYHLKKLNIFEAFSEYKIYDEEEDLIQLNESNIEFYLPRIMSIRPYGRKISQVKKEISNSNTLIKYIRKPTYNDIEDKNDDDDDDMEEEKDEDDINEDIEEVRQLLKFFKSHRYDDYHQWMIVGWGIFNISKGSDKGLDIWLDFSRQSKKYNEAKCIYSWTNMENRKKITLGTFKYFAKQDNPEGYQKYITEKNKKNMIKEIRSTHHELAQLLYQQYSNEFVHSDTSGWFQFADHRWRSIEKGVELRKKISKDLVDFFESVREEIAFELGKARDKDRVESLDKKHKEAFRVIQCLKTSHFKNNIMTECQEVFHIRDFEKKLNTNRYLIGFKNGVYDLENNIFRDGLPSDHISTQMAINYREFDESDSRVREVDDFLKKVFPDSSLRRYFMDVMSETFVGYNHRKNVWFWTGEGDNGKSITQMFFEKMFGKLSIKCPTTLITSKRQNTGSANAELARAGNGVRTIFLEEPDPDEEIFTGIFKHLSGNDNYYARDLFQKGKEVQETIPMFKLFLICNKLPKIRGGGDKATWNRVRVIPFESTFSKKAPSSVEEQLRDKTFPVDPNLAQRIPYLVEPFAWMLLKHRLLPKIDEPEKVVAATDRYKKTNDFLHQFCSQLVVDDEKSFIQQTELYYKYKEWVEENTPSTRPIPLLDFNDYFSNNKKWDINENGCWIGKRIKFEVGKDINKNGNLNRIL